MTVISRKKRNWNVLLVSRLPCLFKFMFVVLVVLMAIHSGTVLTRRNDWILSETTTNVRANSVQPPSSSLSTTGLLEQVHSVVGNYVRSSSSGTVDHGRRNAGTEDDPSKTATVMGVATGYRLSVFHLFVGSLRRSGFTGNIILGVSPESEMADDVKEYLKSQNVTMKHLQFVNCTYENFGTEGCVYPYQDIKIRWSRFPLQRDWLLECDQCTGPVLVSDIRDAFFQENPFGRSKSTGQSPPPVQGLQVFEENPVQTTDHWVVSFPVEKCKGIKFTKPMLCSGTTIGTREAMLRYLTDMHEEMKLWMVDENCRTEADYDDQSIHNYLFYTGKLPYATAIPPRMGIVNTVGVDGGRAWVQYEEYVKYIQKNHPDLDPSDIENVKKIAAIPHHPYIAANTGTKGWIGPVNFLNYTLTDEDGYFINDDGTRSRVIHQWDRFGHHFDNWLQKNGFHES